MGKFYPKLSCFHSPARCFENMLNTANNDLKPSQTQWKSQFCSSQQHAHTVFPLWLVGYLPVPTCRHDWLKDQLHILSAPPWPRLYKLSRFPTQPTEKDRTLFDKGAIPVQDKQHTRDELPTGAQCSGDCRGNENSQHRTCNQPWAS